jgi:hypothetical protein
VIEQLPLFVPAVRAVAPPAPSLASLVAQAAALGYALDGPTDIGLYRLSPLGPHVAQVAAASPYAFLRGSPREVADLLAAIADGRQARTGAETAARLRAEEES